MVILRAVGSLARPSTGGLQCLFPVNQKPTHPLYTEITNLTRKGSEKCTYIVSTSFCGHALNLGLVKVTSGVFGFVKCFIECRHLEFCKTCIIWRVKKEQVTLSSLTNMSGLMEINEHISCVQVMHVHHLKTCRCERATGMKTTGRTISPQAQCFPMELNSNTQLQQTIKVTVTKHWKNKSSALLIAALLCCLFKKCCFLKKLI